MHVSSMRWPNAAENTHSNNTSIDLILISGRINFFTYPWLLGYWAIPGHIFIAVHNCF